MAKILVVDDDPMVRDDMKWDLGEWGHEGVFAANAEEGLARFKEGGIDLVLTDNDMPNEDDGIKMVGKIRKIDSGVRIIMRSGRYTDQAKAQAGAAGVNRFVSKTIGQAQLKHEIEEQLRQCDLPGREAGS